jgi:hypothetical protein
MVESLQKVCLGDAFVYSGSEMMPPSFSSYILSLTHRVFGSFMNISWGASDGC